MAEVMIPPWVRPESPETIRTIDDATVAFQPAFGRGMTQRGIFADPRWGLRRRYRGLRSDEKAAILNALNETRGQFNILRVTPHTPIRGSFATSELLSNPTFASGTTGWTTSGEYTQSVSDRVLRAVRSAVTANQYALYNSASITVTQYAPYCARFMVGQGKGSYSNGLAITETVDNTVSATSMSFGLITHSVVARTAALRFGLNDLVASGQFAGDYLSISYASVARCALVDNRPNLLIRTDEIDNASWTKTNVSVSAGSGTAPDGSATAEFLTENTTNAFHSVLQTVTVSSAAQDYAFCVPVAASNRNFCFLEVSDGTSFLNQYFSLTAGGAVGATGSAGATWANRRAFTVNMGGGWVLCCLVGRKTGSATSLSCTIGSATADGTGSYLGTSVAAIAVWRASFAASSVPMAIRGNSTSPVASGFTQSGSALTIKGLPASTNGLLLTGDWVDINGELKQVTARLDSDAAGLGYLQFRPSLAGSPADNDPIVVQEPFGRFIYPGGTREFENLFGIYGDCEMNLEEIYS